MADPAPKSNRGGARPGAGRKPKHHQPATAVANLDLRAALASDAPELIETEAQRHAAVALDQLVLQMQHGKSDAQRVVACNAILDRGYGRPSVDTGLDMLPFLGKAPVKSSLSEIRLAARGWARVAIAVLERIMTGSDSEAARVAAAKSILERGLGVVGVAKIAAKDRDPAPAQPRDTSWSRILGAH